MNAHYWKEMHGLTRPSLQQYLITMPFIIVLVAGIVSIITPILSNLESRFLPVVDNYRILSYTGDSVATVIDAEYVKKRECNYIRMEWWYEENGLSVRADVDRARTSLRRKGKVIVKGVRVELSEEQIKGNTTAYVYHQCHPFWVTKTKFYP